MTAVPKPKPCGQNWLDMKPAERGRTCGQCSKVITDFSKMSWAEIEQVHLQKKEAVCGMYSPAQLDHWGHEIPKSGCSKFAATAALLISLTASTQATGQAPVEQDTTKRTIIHGTVTGKSIEGSIDTLDYATVVLKNTTVGVTTNGHGHYELDVTDYLGVIAEPTIVFSYIGYERFELKLDNDNTKGELNYNVEMNEGAQLTDFYVRGSTRAERIKWKFKRCFSWIRK